MSNITKAIGKEIMALVYEYQLVGKYEVKFDTPSLPRGVYFYQLKAGECVQTRKMILLK